MSSSKQTIKPKIQIFPSKNFQLEIGFELWELFIVLSVVFSIAAGVLWWATAIPRSREEDFVLLEQHKHLLYAHSLVFKKAEINIQDPQLADFLKPVEPKAASDILNQSGMLQANKNYQTVINSAQSQAENNQKIKVDAEISNLNSSLQDFEKWEKSYLQQNSNIKFRPVYIF